MALFGLIGWPIEHSLSPALHNAGFQVEGLDNEYTLVPIQPEKFETAITSVLGMYTGLNVTTPYKQRVIPFLDVISDTAEKIQAVNTIYRLPDGRLYGDSTDGAGFWLSSGIKSDMTVVMIGAGGAARAIMATKPNDVKLQVLNRRSEHFDQYEKDVAMLLGNDLLALDAFNDWSSADVVIDATSQGLENNQSILSDSQLSQLNKKATLIDLKYRSELTPLLRKGKELGLAILDGKGMLLEQAILSHQAWINAEPNRKSMTHVLTDHI